MSQYFNEATLPLLYGDAAPTLWNFSSEFYGELHPVSTASFGLFEWAAKRTLCPNRIKPLKMPKTRISGLVNLVFIIYIGKPVGSRFRQMLRKIHRTKFHSGIVFIIYTNQYQFVLPKDGRKSLNMVYKVGFYKWNSNLADLGLELIPSGKEHLSFQ